MCSSKQVTFAEAVTTFNYPRVAASDIYNVYWQEHDYRRFREEKFLDDLRAGRAQQPKATPPLSPRVTQRRDSLTGMMNDVPVLKATTRTYTSSIFNIVCTTEDLRKQRENQ
jgi:hypothetical protein